MKASEALKLTELLIGAFPRPKVGADTVQVYAAKIQALEYTPADRAINELIDECDWLPTIAQIRRRTHGHEEGVDHVESAWHEVLAKVGSCGVYRSPKFSSRITEAAVALLGWEAICKCPVSSQPFMRKEFREIYEDMRARALHTPKGRSLLADHERRGLSGLHESAVPTKSLPVVEDLAARLTEGASD